MDTEEVLVTGCGVLVFEQFATGYGFVSDKHAVFDGAEECVCSEVDVVEVVLEGCCGVEGFLDAVDYG
jgi:hypothetical protein